VPVTLKAQAVAREFQLLLHCATAQPDAEVISGIVDSGIDWESLFELAERHRVRPLLYRSLKSSSWDAVPPTRRLELECFYKANAVQNLRAAGELLRLVDALRKERVAVAAFKGPVLAEVTYGDLFFREFVDVDFFVREEHLDKAEEVLTSSGYRTYRPGRPFRSAFLSYYCQQMFKGPNGVVVDLHWRLASKNVAFPIRPAEIWGRLRRATISGREIATLADEDLALFLAAHGTKEGWERLMWVCDFAELLRKHRDIDWKVVLDRAQRAHSSRPLLLAIALASTLLEAPAPNELVEKARNDASVQALAQEAKVGMLRAAASEGEFRELLNGLKTYDSVRYAIWPLAMLLMTRTLGDYQAMPLPQVLWRIYHLSRPVRLATRAAQTLLRSTLLRSI
jgi:hypothetical protein